MRTVLACEGANGSSWRESVLNSFSIRRSDRSTRSDRSERSVHVARTTRTLRTIRTVRTISYGQLRKQAFGTALIGFDLRAQRVDILELPFVTQPQHEPEAHVPSVQVAAVSHHERLDRRLRRVAEGRTHA